VNENAPVRESRQGLKRALAAFAYGFMGALAFPPTDIFPILAVSFPALIILLRAAPTLLSAFITGWSFAFGYFLLGLYWIATALFVDIGHFWWAVPLAVAGLPAVCALYYGLALALAWRMGLAGIGGCLVTALSWFLADYARGHLLTGFPWNLEAYVWSSVLPVMQSVSVVGSYGLTLLTLVAACLPVALIDKTRRSRLTVAAGFAMFVVLGGLGMWRMAATEAAPPIMRVRVVQPNVAQELKWDNTGREQRFDDLLKLSAAPSEKPIDAMVWPETAATFYIVEDDLHRNEIAAILPRNTILLTGVIRRSLNINNQIDYANSMIAMNASGRILDSYDKFHLVPFGEYIPFRFILPGRTIAGLGVDFTPGPGVRTLHVGNLPSFSPLICYEAIFPGNVARQDDRPQLLVNITNDGWYGRTAGPYQHFAIARTRAIEEGVSLVRAANTGISGVIDPYGRVVAKLNLGDTGVVDADVPAPLPPTLYSRCKDWPAAVLFCLLALAAVVLRRSQNQDLIT
jgi:apolipoprotein N-acyltransferase